MTFSKKTIAEFKINSDKFLNINLEGFRIKINDLNESSSATATDFLELILAGALALDSSDIHFEPAKDSAQIRLRIDGLLYESGHFNRRVYDYLVNRIKLLAEMKINLHNIAQDGRFTAISKSDIEIRVSVNPSEFGETIVLRILDPQKISLYAEELGLRPDDQEIVFTELKKPNGMILVTGPTGSGKTTTLYAFLKTLHKPEIKIITIEDPIEYRLAGVEQTQVDEAADYTFDNGLRSILRQDPDIILVGEIRDVKTAEMAIHASLTGHLVFSTLHTNDAIGAVPRLIDLGIKPQIIGPALSLVIAQRLIRRICQDCRQLKALTPNLRSQVDNLLNQLPLKIDKKPYENAVLYEPNGCGRCNFTGYKGRVGIYELFCLTRKFEPLLVKEITETQIEEEAIKSGFIPLQVDGVLKAITGITSLEEVERITGPIQWSLKKD